MNAAYKISQLSNTNVTFSKEVVNANNMRTQVEARTPYLLGKVSATQIRPDAIQVQIQVNQNQVNLYYNNEAEMLSQLESLIQPIPSM
jgi:hypothetical protein